MFEELSIVELTHDIKEYKLKKGDSGTIVLVYKEGKAYEVEFVAPNGKTIALLTLMPDDICLSLNKGVYFFHERSTPIYISNASGITYTIGAENVLRGFDAIFGVDKMRVKEKSGSKVSMEEFSFPTATL